MTKKLYSLRDFVTKARIFSTANNNSGKAAAKLSRKYPGAKKASPGTTATCCSVNRA